jgi:hypothetical protein
MLTPWVILHCLPFCVVVFCLWFVLVSVLFGLLLSFELWLSRENANLVCFGVPVFGVDG